MSLFHRRPGRSEAQAATEAARGVLEILKLSRANLGSAEALLKEAEANLAREAFEKAIDLAQKGERIATTLESEYRNATEARDLLRQHAERLKDLGVSDAEVQKALGEVRARARATRELEGVAVPDYAGALAVASEAATTAGARIALGENATDVVFAAELAVGGAEAAGGPAQEAIEEARDLLAKARAEAQEGQFELAATDASVAEKIALAAAERRRTAKETLVSLEKVIVGLRIAGVAVGSVKKSLDVGKTLLEKGKVSAAVEVFNDVAQQAVSLGTRSREVLDLMSAASAAIDALEAEGLSVSEAHVSLNRARAAVKVGNYALASECCEDVHRAARKQREFREGLRAWLDQTKARLTALRERGVSFVNDAEEMVQKAEREFAKREYDATGEDLRIASLLMGRHRDGKARQGPTPP